MVYEMSDFPDKYKMPWGKHRGQDIWTLPSAYLYWLAENAEDLKLKDCELIGQMAGAEWRHRERYNNHMGKARYPNME